MYRMRYISFRDLLWQLKWLPLAYRKRLCSSAPTYAQLHAAAQHLFQNHRSRCGRETAADTPWDGVASSGAQPLAREFQLRSLVRSSD